MDARPPRSWSSFSGAAIQHGVSFEEAETVLFDDDALFMADPDHSEREERFVLLGLSTTPRVLVVCHCYRRKGDVIRIISARKANRTERNQYARKGKS